MHPFYDALPVPYVQVDAGYMRFFGRTSVYLCASLLKNLQYLRTFILLSLSLCNSLVNPIGRGVGQAGFKSSDNVFLLA